MSQLVHSLFAFALILVAASFSVSGCNGPAARKRAKSFKLKIMKGLGHFPMLEAPEEFNKLLAETIKELEKQVRGAR